MPRAFWWSVNSAFVYQRYGLYGYAGLEVSRRLGVPLVLFFNTLGLNPVVALAGMTIIWPLGDAIPPTAIIGRLTVATIGMKEPYGRFLKNCLVPAVLIAVVGTLMVVFSKKLAFLTVF